MSEHGGERDAGIEFGGLTHHCGDPGCHVAGFVATLKHKTRPSHGRLICQCRWQPSPLAPSCPDCGGLTTWLCTGASDCRAPLHEHGCFADIDGQRCDDLDHWETRVTPPGAGES